MQIRTRSHDYRMTAKNKILWIRQNITALKNHASEELAHNVFKIAPFSAQETQSLLCLMFITHGNEVGGLGILSHFIQNLQAGKISLSFPITVILGNQEAFLAHKRFIEEDLNRSFAKFGTTSYEACRARQIEPFLRTTPWLIDFHQTIGPTNTPFFIFPFSRKGAWFAHQLNPQIPIITHWQGGFSQDGMCTDEYVNSNKGTGITIETGQKGYAEEQIFLGVTLIKKALLVLDQLQKNSAFLDFNPNFLNQLTKHIFTMRQVIRPEKATSYQLEKGFYNFFSVQKNALLCKTSLDEIRADTDGFTLFPKYEINPENPPKELLRIVGRLRSNEVAQLYGL